MFHVKHHMLVFSAFEEMERLLSQELQFSLVVPIFARTLSQLEIPGIVVEGDS